MVVHVLRPVSAVQIEYGVQAVFSAQFNRPVKRVKCAVPQSPVLFKVHIRKRYAHHVHAEVGNGFKIPFVYVTLNINLFKFVGLSVGEGGIGFHGFAPTPLGVNARVKPSHIGYAHPRFLNKPVAEVYSFKLNYISFAVV